MNLIDQFKQIWSTSVDNSPKALNYRLYKKGVSFENYLEILKDKDLFLLCRFRTSNHRLPIEIKHIYISFRKEVNKSISNQ
jgi:hypothetical protein